MKRFTIRDASGDVVMDLPEGKGFTLEGKKFPRAWLAHGAALPEGYTAESYTPDPPAPPPPLVRMWTSKVAFVRELRKTGKWSGVTAALARASSDVKEDWEFSYELHRDGEIIAAIADALSLTATEVDALFAAANPR